VGVIGGASTARVGAVRIGFVAPILVGIVLTNGCGGDNPAPSAVDQSPVAAPSVTDAPTSRDTRSLGEVPVAVVTAGSSARRLRVGLLGQVVRQVNGCLDGLVQAESVLQHQTR
jgi:hypothetical protein